jgi:hypothetical protein
MLLGLCMALSLIAVRAVARSPSSPPFGRYWRGSRPAPVVVDGVTLFHVTGVSAFPAEKRAQAIADRIRTVAANRAYAPQALRSKDEPTGTGQGQSIPRLLPHLLIRCRITLTQNRRYGAPG